LRSSEGGAPGADPNETRLRGILPLKIARLAPGTNVRLKGHEREISAILGEKKPPVTGNSSVGTLKRAPREPRPGRGGIG